MITVADIEAAIDVLDQLTDEIDSFDAAVAIRTSDALAVLRGRVDLAMSLLKSRTLTAMDGQPIQVDKTVFYTKPSGKWRPDWRRIETAVVDAIMAREISGRGRVWAAVDLMRELYVSPSTVPKTGALEKMGLDLKDVARWEKGVDELKREHVEDDPE